MAFRLPNLPFAGDALAPHMSAETLEFHHGKHHAAYVKKTNEMIEGKQGLSGASLTDVVRSAGSRARQNCSTTARSCGTTASSGSASRPRTARGRAAGSGR